MLSLSSVTEITLYEHCRRASEKGTTPGVHGMPLMGGGDWNDGMNRVGMKGRGESIWLGWFLYATLKSFAPLATLMNDPAPYHQRAEKLAQALEANAWDGEWYLRAYYDDGSLWVRRKIVNVRSTRSRNRGRFYQGGRLHTGGASHGICGRMVGETK